MAASPMLLRLPIGQEQVLEDKLANQNLLGNGNWPNSSGQKNFSMMMARDQIKAAAKAEHDQLHDPAGLNDQMPERKFARRCRRHCKSSFLSFHPRRRPLLEPPALRTAPILEAHPEHPKSVETTLSVQTLC